jgi:mediator of RNA polymerase II transcription subunit 12
MAELLADVYCYLVDGGLNAAAVRAANEFTELPREARPALQAALSKLQAVNSSPQKAPTAVYLAQLLPYSSPPRRAMTLVDTDAGDNTWLFEDRPWEASEQLEPLERPIKYQDSFLDSAPLKNNSSIPLSAFDAKLCRDKVPLTEESMPWLSYASERNLGNGLAGEPSGTSLQATTIYNGDFQAPQPAPCASEGPWCATSPSVASTYTREQPDQHAPTRSSGVNPSAPGSTNDPIEIDDDEDDEIELVPPPAKKMKTSNPKPTTGSKTVGRKTASKTVRAAPVSARGKGRRKSQAD